MNDESNEDKFWQSIRAPRWKGKEVDITLSEVDETDFRDEVMHGIMVNLSETGAGLRVASLPRGVSEGDMIGRRYLLEFNVHFEYGLSPQFLTIARLDESRDERLPFYLGAKFDARVKIDKYLEMLLKGSLQKTMEERVEEISVEVEGGGALQYRFELVPLEKLHVHEEYKPERFENVYRMIKRLGKVDVPILADESSYVIIDGHHRYWTCKRLGCKRIPAVLVDYMDDRIVEFSVRPESPCQGIKKKDIIEMGLSQESYPFKTTKHRLLISPDTISISLEALK